MDIRAVAVTDEMKEAYKHCGDDADCNECPCQIGNDDCIFNHEGIEE